VTRTIWVALAAAGSLGLLAGAFIFQAMGYSPCSLCVWQRWPHGAAVAVGVLALALPWTILPLAGALAAMSSAAIGVYHTGVERTWWEGPSTCTATPIGQLSPQELMEHIMTAPLIRCDEVAWAFAGLSMASWNAILSAGLAMIWLVAFGIGLRET
jgi:disulfide bond formation protein DsbB